MTFEEWKFTKCPAKHYPLTKAKTADMELAWNAALEHNPPVKFVILMCKKGKDEGLPIDYGIGDEPFPEQLLTRCHIKGFATEEEARAALEDTLEQNGEMEYVKKHYFSIIPVS